MKSVKYTVRLKENIAHKLEKTGMSPVAFIRGATVEKLENGGLNHYQQTVKIYEAIDKLENKYPDIDFSELKGVL